MDVDLPSLDFIAGLVSAHGSFIITKQGKSVVHSFQLKMEASERELFEGVRSRLGLSELVLEYTNQNRHYVLLLIRDRETILKTIIPNFDERLFGTRKATYEEWKKSFYDSVLNSKYKKYLISLL